jgi:hypothetical protein
MLCITDTAYLMNNAYKVQRLYPPLVIDMRKDTSRIALPADMVKVIDHIIKNVSCFGYTSRPEFMNSLVRRFVHDKVRDNSITPEELSYEVKE